MQAETYYPAPEVAERYMRLLPRFGAEPIMARWAADYTAGHAGRCLWDARFLAKRYRTGRLLNIGGAPYLFEMILKEESPGLEIQTIDLDPGRFPGVDETLGIHTIVADIENPDWQLAEKFDCIVCAEVIEHMRIDLLGTVRRIRDHLAPQGILYLTTPNGLSFWNVFVHFLRGRTGPPPSREWEKLATLGHMGHVREYSILEIKEILQSCGITIDEMILRNAKEARWPLRDVLLRLRSEFAGEMVVIGRAG